jgi:HK97 family phage major capsid protein
MVKAAGISPENHGAIVAMLEKSASDPQLNPSGDYIGAIQQVDYNILKGVRRPLTIAGLFGPETTTAASVSYFVEGAAEGGPTTIAENGAYPQLHVAEPTKVTEPVKKIGTFWKDSDELLSDAQRLAQHINERADYLMDIVEEDQLFGGNGTGSNILGLVNRTGLQVMYYDPTSVLDLLLKIKSAKKYIKKLTPGFRADGILISDDDWDTLTSLRDSNNQFLAGGPFYGMYGNTQVAEEPPLWGLRSVPSQATAEGLIVVGAWRLGGSVLRNGGRTVEVTNSNEADFINGRVTFRTTERVGLKVPYPAAFMKLKSATFTAEGDSAKYVANTQYYARTGSAGAYIYTLVDTSAYVAGTTSTTGLYKATAI